MYVKHNYHTRYFPMKSMEKNIKDMLRCLLLMKKARQCRAFLPIKYKD